MGGGGLADGENGAADELTGSPSEVSGDATDNGPADNLDPAGDDPQMPVSDSNPTLGDNASSIMQGVMQQTGGPPDAPWQEADGDGGAMAYFDPSLSFVLRQTEQTHAEITEHFQQMRAMLVKRGLNPNMVPVNPRDTAMRNEQDVYALIQLLQINTGGPPDSPWVEADGDGGSVSYERPAMALSIRQTPQTLDEIAGVLVQLRRNRYGLIHQSRPWEQGVFLDRQPGLFSGPWLTPFADTGDLMNAATEVELAALKVRRELSSGHWKWTDESHTRTSDFDLQTAGDKLAMEWPGWQVRVQGAQAAVTLTDLHYAELGTWGQSLRDWLDVEIAFWPHRSNRELALLFDVIPVAAKPTDGANQLRLWFKPARIGTNPLWIEIVYDKTTGLPVTWEAYRQEALVQRFRFQPEMVEGHVVRLIVRQESNRGQLLAQGEWILNTKESGPIADVDAFPADTLTVDRRPQNRVALNAFETGLQQMRIGRQAQAAKVFQQVLEQHPNHPLVQFLVAWSLDQQSVGQDSEEVRTAYSRVIQSASSDLVRLLVRQSSRKLSDKELYELMQSRPVAKRDVADEIALAKLALQSSEPRRALEHARAAWDRYPSTPSQLVDAAQLVVESLLRVRDREAAILFYDELSQNRDESRRANPITPALLSQLLSTFEYFGRGREMLKYYEELIQRNDPSMTVELRRSLHKRLADITSGLVRWQHLLTAIELLPLGAPDGLTEWGVLINELDGSRDPVAASALADRAKYPIHRQVLQAEQAYLTTDLELAQELYWKLHQEGFLHEQRLLLVCDRFIQTNRPERAVAVMEAYMKARGTIMTGQERLTLAKSYTLSNRPLDAKRALSEESR